MRRSWREMGISGASGQSLPPNFGVNLFVPDGCHQDPLTWTQGQLKAAQEARSRHLRVMERELGVCLDEPGAGEAAPFSVDLGALRANFAAQIDTLIEQKVRVVSFHFGFPDESQVEGAMKGSGMFLIGNATSAREAEFLVERGADCVVAQGKDMWSGYI